MLARIKPAVSALRDPKMHRYSRSCGLYMFPPYPSDAYRRLLMELQDAGGNWPHFVEIGPADGTSIYVRHDIDTLACVQNAKTLTAINLELGIPAAVYFRVDAEDYVLSEHAELARELAGAGFEVGLHTSCYAHDRPFDKLRADTLSFRDATGLTPRSFTLHGLGYFNFWYRTWFRYTIRFRLAEFGYEFTDCSRGLRVYRHVVEDCHIDPNSGHRCLKTDVLSAPNLIGITGNLLVLTHPCYWKD